MILNKLPNAIKITALFLLVLLSGCSTTHHQFGSQFSIKDLKQITPQYAAIQNGHIEYYRFGHGTPIVLISGYATDITSWDKQFLTLLAEKHQLIVFNNRNVGGSSIQSNYYESQDLASDTYQLIEKLHLRKPSVLGISMGGMIAQQLAVLYPNKIGQLILINTAIAGKQSVHPHPDIEKMMLHMPTNKLGRYKVALKNFFPASEQIQMGLALAFDRFQPKTYTEIDFNSVIAQQRFLVLRWTKNEVAAKKIARLNLPVLILNGNADQVIPPVNSDILAKTIPHAELRRWQNGGHAMIYQYPESIANAINEFITKSESTHIQFHTN